MGGDTLAKIESTGGGVGLKKGSWASDCTWVNPSCPWDRLRRKARGAAEGMCLDSAETLGLAFGIGESS